MKIKRIGFGYTKNLGNYENCKMWLEADLEEWEDPSESLNVLRNRVVEELELPDKWHDLKHQLAKQTASLEALTSIMESKKTQLAKAEEAWENFAEFLTAHGVDPVALKIENFAATRADHSLAEAAKTESVSAKYVADDSPELGFGESDRDDDEERYTWNQDDDDDDY